MYDMKCELDFFQKDIRPAQSYIDFHTHPSYELVYYTSGKGTTTIGNQAFAYRKGQFSIIEPDCPHDEYRESSTGVIFLGFFYDPNNTPIPIHNCLFTDSSHLPILQLLDKISYEIHHKQPCSATLIHCYLVELVIEIGRMIHTGTTNSDPNEHLLYARSYIEQYALDKINLPALAQTLGYSYDYFRHLFKSFTGYSPKQYIIHLRFEKTGFGLDLERESTNRDTHTEGSFRSLAQGKRTDYRPNHTGCQNSLSKRFNAAGRYS